MSINHFCSNVDFPSHIFRYIQAHTTATTAPPYAWCLFIFQVVRCVGIGNFGQNSNTPGWGRLDDNPSIHHILWTFAIIFYRFGLKTVIFNQRTICNQPSWYIFWRLLVGTSISNCCKSQNYWSLNRFRTGKLSVTKQSTGCFYWQR